MFFNIYLGSGTHEWLFVLVESFRVELEQGEHRERVGERWIWRPGYYICKMKENNMGLICGTKKV